MEQLQISDWQDPLKSFFPPFHKAQGSHCRLPGDLNTRKIKTDTRNQVYCKFALIGACLTSTHLLTGKHWSNCFAHFQMRFVQTSVLLLALVGSKRKTNTHNHKCLSNVFLNAGVLHLLPCVMTFTTNSENLTVRNVAINQVLYFIHAKTQ